MPEWITISGAKDVALFLLAIYGAALSTFNWRQAARRDRRTVVTKMTTLTLSYADGRLSPPIAQLIATNTGQRPVTIDSMFIELEGGSRLFATMQSAFAYLPDTPLPVTLRDGESAKLHMSYQEIGEALLGSGRTTAADIRFVATDTAGGEYRSSPWSVDPQEFQKMGLA